MRVFGLMMAVCVGWVGAGGQAMPERSYVLVVDGKVVTQTGYYRWNEDDKLRRYARSHEGSYVAFLERDAVYRVDAPAAVKTVQDLYAPMVPLGVEQERLSALQKPLAAKQAALAKEMATAVGPEGVGRVGQKQGEVGRQQGEIGSEQGRVGQLQGKAGTALYGGFKKIADECLAAGSCAKVG